MSTYRGTHLTYQQQLDRLKERGLQVADDQAALSHLCQLGYYRLSAYWYPMRKSILVQDADTGSISRKLVDEFEDDATFEGAVELYLFDKKLRLLLMDAVERIEVAMRVDVAYELGRHSAFAQEDASLLDGNFTRREKESNHPDAKDLPSRHDVWLSKLASQVEKSKEDFVAHYRSKYDLPLPIWVVIEVWDFGLLSHFYSGMRYTDQVGLAQRFQIPNPRLAKSWMRTINYVRNIVAHHSRLWNRNMIDMPILPRAGEMGAAGAVLRSLDASRPYATLCVISHLMSTVCPDSGWAGRVAEHLSSFPAGICSKVKIASMGCPDGWETHPFWQ